MSDTNPTGRSATTIGGEDRWLRLLYMVIFAIISYSLLWLILFLAAVQFILAWINGQPNDNLRDFTVKLDAYFRDRPPRRRLIRPRDDTPRRVARKPVAAPAP